LVRTAADLKRWAILVWLYIWSRIFGIATISNTGTV